MGDEGMMILINKFENASTKMTIHLKPFSLARE
jgi:hypothetical protein